MPHVFENWNNEECETIAGIDVSRFLLDINVATQQSKERNDADHTSKDTYKLFFGYKQTTHGICWKNLLPLFPDKGGVGYIEVWVSL